MKVMTIVGTRPEIIRLSRIIARFDRDFEHTLVHTGQNFDYELNEIFFEQLQVRKPDFFLETAGGGAAETIAKVISAADKCLAQCEPDAVLILGDTNSGLAAIAAKRRKIPIFHMEAGNRCFDLRVPEEINRKIIDHISDINLPYSDIAREYLLREGMPPDRVIKTGSPMLEVLTHYRPGIDASSILETLGLQPQKYFVVSAHREENIDSDVNVRKFIDVLNAVANTYSIPVVVSTHPRTAKRLDSLKIETSPLVRFVKPFGFFDYVKLQLEAHAVISDSGTITEEASILNLHAINLREAHERPEGTEECSVIFTGLSVERVLDGLKMLAHQPRDRRTLRIVAEYDVPNVSEKMARIVLGYRDYVMRNVWRQTT